MKPIKVAVFEDNQLRRDLLKMLLDDTDGFACTGVFNDCRDILKHIVNAMPDVILMDINMPHVNGIEGLKLVRKQFPKIKILMQTIFDDDDKILDCIINGADGYLLKKAPPLKIIEAIQEVMEGGAPMTPAVARKVLQLVNNKNKKAIVKDVTLTSREEEILYLLMQGHSYKMIAEEANIAFATVNTHITHIYQKLQVKNAVEAVKKFTEQKQESNSGEDN
jgi:DNA-binding NarL/FixJ family response regulator